MDTLVCIDCHTEKPLDDFYRKSKSPIGRRQPCKRCQSKRNGQTPHRSPLLPTMICTKCGLQKGLECFYRASRNKNGHCQPCIACLKARWRAKRDAYLASVPPAMIIPEGMKRCSQCKAIKALEEFYRHKGEKDGRSQPCKACSKTYEKTYRETHKEQIATLELIYRQNNKEKMYTKQKETKKQKVAEIKKQRAEYRQKHREELREKLLEWTRQHPEKVQEYTSRRRALQSGATINDLTAAQWRMIKEMYDHRCVYCRKKFARLSQDHITPLSQGGNHTFTNVVPACKSCNSKKNKGPVLSPIQPLLLLPPC